jgi:hypothetical protein
MRKLFVFCLILLSLLTIIPCAELTMANLIGSYGTKPKFTVLAINNPTVIVEQPWWRTTGISQPTEFTARAEGGTPPYTYQWYITYLDPALPPERWLAVAVPNSNTSTFKFVESTLGRYGISLRITDSNGESEYQSFQPMGIVVTVQSSPVASPSPSLPPTNSPTPSVPEFSWLTILPFLLAIPIVLVIVRKRLQRND